MVTCYHNGTDNLSSCPKLGIRDMTVLIISEIFFSLMCPVLHYFEDCGSNHIFISPHDCMGVGRFDFEGEKMSCWEGWVATII